MSTRGNSKRFRHGQPHLYGQTETTVGVCAPERSRNILSTRADCNYRTLIVASGNLMSVDWLVAKDIANDGTSSNY
jgi:hypothetical protein